MKKKQAAKAATATPAKVRPFLSTLDSRREVEEARPVPLRRGPQIGQLTPAQELLRTASKDELAEFAQVIRERRAKSSTVSWMRCTSCGFAGAFDPARVADGSICPACNWHRLASGGHLRVMTPEAAQEYHRAKAERDALAVKRMKDGSFAKRNEARAKNGIAPMTRGAFDEEQRRWAAENRQRAAQLNNITSIYREKMGTPIEKSAKG